MALKRPAGSSASDNRFAEELDYLYKRLHTVDNLIRTLEDYDRIRPKPAHLRIQEKTA
jgi:hypothetical protein